MGLFQKFVRKAHGFLKKEGEEAKKGDKDAKKEGDEGGRDVVSGSLERWSGNGEDQR